MRNLLEYDEWLKAEYALYKGEVHEIVARDSSSGVLTLKNKSGTFNVKETDPNVQPLDNNDDQLTTFMQISAPTITI